jgi:CDP-glucose 4,6-dehydratase
MFSNFFANKRVLVTGNTGFKGAWLSIWLDELGAEVHGISNGVLTNPSIFESLDLTSKIRYHQADVRDLQTLAELVIKIQPDIVFHLAAQALVFDAYDDPVSTMATNVMGTANVLESLRKSDFPCLAVMITSDKCYENVEWPWGYRENDTLGGKDPYSASKACAELVIHTFYRSFFSSPDCPIRLVSTRAGNVIGGGDWSLNRIVPDCIKAWTQNKSVELRRPNATRPWQHVLEPLSGYLRVAQSLGGRAELSGESYNFGPNADQNHSVLRLLQELRGHWFEGKESFEPMKVSSDESRPEAGLLKLSCDKALAHLDWRPTMEFEKTAQFTADWYKAFYSGDRKELETFTRNQIREYCELASSKRHSWARS